jgi:glycine/D-amino acid oxidase-like deaminating enzyme
VTHPEVYPRASEVYICGVGGSEYVEPEQLRRCECHVEHPGAEPGHLGRAGEYPPGQVHADPARVEAPLRRGRAGERVRGQWGLSGGLAVELSPPPLAPMEAAARAFSTMSRRLGGQPDASQACMRPCAPDAMPLMGKALPESPTRTPPEPHPNAQVAHVRGAYISAGHNCWGILWAPVSGLAMSELILEGAPQAVDLRAFDPGRFMRAAAGGRGRKRGIRDVGEQW